jgi:hypothetical protein
LSIGDFAIENPTKKPLISLNRQWLDRPIDNEFQAREEVTALTLPPAAST